MKRVDGLIEMNPIVNHKMLFTAANSEKMEKIK